MVKMDEFIPYFALLKDKMLSVSAGFASNPLTRDSALNPVGGYTSRPPLQAHTLCLPLAPDFYEEIYWIL